MQDTSKVRTVLECMAIDSASFPLSEAKLQELERIDREQHELIASHPEDNLRFAELDKEFHCAIAECCDNASLIEFIQNINNVMVRINVLSGTLPQNRQDALIEHENIIAFLKKGQREFAKVALSEHLKHVEERMLSESKKER